MKKCRVGSGLGFDIVWYCIVALQAASVPSDPKIVSLARRSKHRP